MLFTAMKNTASHWHFNHIEPHSHILMTSGIQRIFLSAKFWPEGIFLGLWKTQGIFWVLYFSSPQINNNQSIISRIYVLCGILGNLWYDQNESWNCQVSAFLEIYYTKIWLCKTHWGVFFFLVNKLWNGIILGICIIWVSVGLPSSHQNNMSGARGVNHSHQPHCQSPKC